MRKSVCGWFGLVLWMVSTQGLAQESRPLVREANTTLRLPQSPPAFGFTTERAFGALRFVDPLAIVSPPGETNRLFIVEQAGRIAVIPDLANPTRGIFLDIATRVAGGVPNDERGLLGLAFHPGYATNRYFYLFYTPPGRNRLSRFEASPDDPNRAQANSEVILLDQVDQAGNHNGGDIHFGPDGYLYVALGDEGGANDSWNNSSFIDRDFFSGILRIDVDKRPGSLPPNAHPAATDHYAVPPDNPYLGLTSFNGRSVNPSQVRTEFYATGLRNPWRMSFDGASGALYTGDVGQDAREEINLVLKGENYGWPFREANIPGPRRAPAGFRGAEPIAVYLHGSRTNQGLSVTGGVVYRGQRLSQIHGHYIFGDYITGYIWSLAPDGTNLVPFQLLTRELSVAGFGIDPRNGDVLLASQREDTIKRLSYSATPTGEPLPARLSETGAFADLAKLKPQPGIVPYELQVPFWSDYARKQRWFSLPDVNQKIGFDAGTPWSFPNGSVWIKHFDLELTRGVPETARRLETRFIVRNENGVYGMTYKWNQEQTDATLVPEEGLDEPIVINDGGIMRTQIWHYPSRSACLGCHTPAAGHVLGFQTAQLNRQFDYGSATANQIEALHEAGYFEKPVEKVRALPRLASPSDSTQSLEFRARSYLAVNCAQCHQPGGPSLGHFDARLQTPTRQAGLIDGALINQQGHPDNRVIRRGSLDRSVLLKRISTRGAGQMPPFASHEVDPAGIELLRAWITNDLPNYLTFAEWRERHFGPNPSEEGLEQADPDQDGANNQFEFLTGTNPREKADVWKVTAERIGQKVRIRFPRVANRALQIQTTQNLQDPNSWQALDGPANHRLFPSQSSVAEIEEEVTPGAGRYYRVAVFEP